MEIQTNKFINDLRQGKPAAQQRLLAEYGPMVFRIVLKMVGQREDAEEVYQDVFVKALLKISTFDPQKASFATWLSRIAYNEALNHNRRSKLDLVFMDDLDLSTANKDIPIDPQRDEQIIGLLEKAMEMLSNEEQALLSLFYYENQSLKDIAFITDSIPSTVGSRLSRIRTKLYHIIKKFKEQ